MILDLKNIDYYYLTHNNEKRKKHMIKEFYNHNLFEINPNTLFNGSGYKSAGSGFLKILEVATNKMNNNFKPFVMLEDDVKKKDNYPDKLEIPNDCDIFYLGHSRYGINKQSLINPIYITYNDNIVKLISMLATHAMMVCSIKGLLYMQKCMMTVFYENQPWDIPLVSSMHTLNVYSSTEELMYQYGPVGGRQSNTLNLIYSKDKSVRKIPRFVYNNSKQFPLLISNNTKKIKIFASWTNCNTIYNRIMNEYDWKSDNKYGVEYIFTKDNDFTHVILMNFIMPNLSINKENVIGLAQEPGIHLGLKPSHINYFKKKVKKYFIGTTKHILSSPDTLKALSAVQSLPEPPEGKYFRFPDSGKIYWSKSTQNIRKDVSFDNPSQYYNHRAIRYLPRDWSNISILTRDEVDTQKENKSNTTKETKNMSTLPFIEKMSYQLPHISYKIINNYIENFPKKNKLINYVYSWKNPGYPTHLYRYRHNLGKTIIKSNLPIDIYGSSTDGLKKNFPNKENIKYGFDLKDVNKIYENYKFCIVIENTREPEYFSEKIIIALLCGCVPIYLGCTNINNYFKDL